MRFWSAISGKSTWCRLCDFRRPSCLTPPACKLSHHVSPLKASASAPPASAKGTPKDRLEVHFNKKLQNDDVPLFANFQTYVKTMPVRRS